MIKKIKVALGIIAGKPLTGPMGVSVDLTRKCTLGCLMCWWQSPLLQNQPSLEWTNQEMDYELFKALIKDLKKIQVKTIILGGQGEPLLYSRIMEVIELIKKAGMKLSLITSGAYFNEDRIKAIVELGVDHIDVSLQAATAETYLKLHPSQNIDLFDKIKNWMILLSRFKKIFNRTIPTLSTVNVICRLNYREIVKMIEVAKEVGAESVGFKRIDIGPETKGLLLTKEELGELKPLLNEAQKRAAELGIRNGLGRYRKYVVDGLTTGVYTADLYSHIPCYVGWRSARILSDGAVIPCCGCDDLALGNITDSSFITIWYSKEYNLFRRQSINIQKDTAIFKRCKCHSCTDHVMNLAMFKKLHPLKSRGICKGVQI